MEPHIYKELLYAIDLTTQLKKYITHTLLQSELDTYKIILFYVNVTLEIPGYSITFCCT